MDILNDDQDTKTRANMDLTIIFINEFLKIDLALVQTYKPMENNNLKSFLLLPNLFEKAGETPVKDLCEEYRKNQSRFPIFIAKTVEQSALLHSYFFHMAFYLRLVTIIKPKELEAFNKTAHNDIQEMISSPIEHIRDKHDDRRTQINTAFRLSLTIETLIATGLSQIKMEPVSPHQKETTKKLKFHRTGSFPDMTS